MGFFRSLEGGGFILFLYLIGYLEMYGMGESFFKVLGFKIFGLELDLERICWTNFEFSFLGVLVMFLVCRS